MHHINEKGRICKANTTQHICLASWPNSGLGDLIYNIHNDQLYCMRSVVLLQTKNQYSLTNSALKPIEIRRNTFHNFSVRITYTWQVCSNLYNPNSE